MILCQLADAIALSHGAYQEAEGLLEESVKIEREHGQAFPLVLYLNYQGLNNLYQGQLEVAEKRFGEARSIGETLGPGFGMWEWERALSNLGRLAHLRGDYAQAKALFTEALELNARHIDPWDIKIRILLEFSKLALTENSLTEAEDLCRRNTFSKLDNYEAFQYAWDRCVYFNQLGVIATLRDEAEAAARYFQQALDLCQQWHFLPAALQLCVSFATLARQQGHEARAAHLFRLAADHPASMFETKEAARRGLEHPSATVEGAGLRHVHVLTLEEIVKHLRS